MRPLFSRGLLLSASLLLLPLLGRAEEILFIGNSYTYGGSEAPIAKFGGIPKVVEAIAKSKGHVADTKMLTVGGKDWGFHLAQPATGEAIKSKTWDWVVLQDYSTKSTHLGNVEEFMKNGQTLYQLIHASSPKARILLYATWARAAGNPMFTGKSTPNSFADPAEMFAEIAKSYADLQARLEALEPEPNQVALAPVGAAFELCLKKYPEIGLYAKDLHHPSPLGSYLSGLVIYASLFNDSPKGATRELPGITIEAATAEKLQAIADEVTAAQRKS